jgi:hypothetical protein
MALASAAVFPNQEGTLSMQSSHTLDQLDTAFDDTHAVANAGLLLPAPWPSRWRLLAAGMRSDVGGDR